jgi:hypothetical protein
LRKYELPVVVNISASSVSEFGELSERILNYNTHSIIKGIEINVS